MLRAQDLEKCHFVPMTTMRKVLKLVDSRSNICLEYCKRNLVKLQMHRCNAKITENVFKNRKNVYQVACYKAIYSHNWDKLLYLLKKYPPWEHNWVDVNEASLYVRALTILLMYHPTAQAKALFNEYLHMVWACRSIEDKKAVLKVLLTLPDKMQGVTRGKYYNPTDN